MCDWDLESEDLLVGIIMVMTYLVQIQSNFIMRRRRLNSWLSYVKVKVVIISYMCNV